MGLSLRFVTMIREEAGNDSSSKFCFLALIDIRAPILWILNAADTPSFLCSRFWRSRIRVTFGREARTSMPFLSRWLLFSLDSESWFWLTNEAEGGVLLALRMTRILKISRLAPPALAGVSCPWSRKCASRWGSFAEWGLILTHDFDWLSRPIKAYFWPW